MGDYNDTMMRNPNAAAGRGTAKTQNRSNVLQLKLIGQSHPTGLTANLLKLFEPRPPLEFKPPPEKRKCPPYSGMAQFVSQFAERDDPEYAPPLPKTETPAEKRARIHQLRLEKGAEKAKEELQKYDPNSDPNISGDPYKTLFVARLNYETSESKIKREFESYGPIKRVKLITDKETNKPKGYAFIEYLHTRDMKAAYKQADGRKIDGRRVLVDVERGRTVPNWRPRRLGGGLGTTRVPSEDASQREVQQAARSSRSEEPRAREDRHSERDTEKSRERRDKEREREKSRERSHDKERDRDNREDRHHRDRDRERGDRERERERGRDRDRERQGERDHDRDKRDRDRDRDRGRDTERDKGRDRGSKRDRDHEGEREKDHEGEREKDDEIDVHDRGHSRDRGDDYERGDSKHERDHYGDRHHDRADPKDDPDWYEHHQLGHKRSDVQREQRYDHYEQHRSRGQYDPTDVPGDRYDHRDSDRYEQMDEDDYRYGHGVSDSRDREHEYRRSERSISREYED